MEVSKYRNEQIVSGIIHMEKVNLNILIIDNNVIHLFNVNVQLNT